MNPSTQRRVVAVAAGVALLVALSVGTALLTRPADAQDKSARPAPAAVPVTSATVQERDLPVYLGGVGTVTAMASVTVKTRIDGQLEAVEFREGQDVRAGQVLARLDPRAQQAQFAQAKAQWAKDQAQLTNARLDLQRYTRLVEEDAATPQQLDTQKALVGQLEAALRMDEAQIQQATVQLGYTTITAPIGGRVGARLVDPGNIVHATDTGGLVVINQIDPIAVVFTLPEGQFQDINRALRANRRPLPVVVYPREGDAPLGSGELILLNNQIDTTTGTVQLKGRLPNASHALWPGQYVNVRLVLGDHQKALVVPAAAVQRSQNGSYVYVVNADQTVQPRDIALSRVQDNLAIVGRGLQAGERVVVDGQFKLKAGTLVRENARAAASAPASAGKAP